MRHAARRTLPWLAALLAACATGPLRPSTGLECRAGEPTKWARYDAPGVTVVTELDELLARELTAGLEQTREALRASVFKNLPPVHVRVYAVPFALPAYAYYTTIDQGVLAHYLSFSYAATSDDEVVIVMQLRGSDPRANVMKPKGLDTRERLYANYALAYVLTHLAIPAPPPWLSRGLATYLEATRVEADTAWVGVPNEETLDLKRYAELFPTQELLALSMCDVFDLARTQGGPRVVGFYYQSFMLTHLLATTRTAAFNDYLKRLAGDQEPGAAWSAAFPDLAPGKTEGLEKLDAQLKQYTRRERYQALGYPVELESFTVARAPLSCVDARAARLALYRGIDLRDPYDREANELLLVSPGHAAALVAKAELAGPEGVATAARLAVEKGPGDARAWVLLAAALPAGAERDAATDKAVALGKGDPVVELRAAELRLEMGRPADAAALATSVVKGVPWSVRGNLTLARALAAQGQCPAARAALARAEACHTRRCPDRPPEPQAPEHLSAPPREALSAARTEVSACRAR
ncbi:MAG: tetratricopeptide repeat protein [Anaeromyxobacteraceae bacterium]